MINKEILLIDDNSNDILLTQRALKINNIRSEVIVANDGLEALDYLFGNGKYSGRDLSQLPVLILLDLKMPRMNGLEVLKQIRYNRLTRVIPVVMLTSSNEESDLIASYDLGCNAYICKPVDFNQFTEAINQLGQFWLGLNEHPSKFKN